MKHGSRRPAGITVHVKGKNMAVPPPLRERVVRKMRSLDRYLDRLQVIDVELSTEPTRDASLQNRCEATTQVLGGAVRVTARAADMNAAIDEAVDKLYRQLNRRKERIKAHHRGELPVEGESVVEPEPAEALHVRRVAMKPQFEEEAAQDLDMLGESFHVFLNARTEQVNVLYRRRNGTLGLIEPAT